MALQQQRMNTGGIKSHYEKAIWAPLETDEIQELSFIERFALIRHMLSHDSSQYKTNSTTIRISLARLSSSFEISDNFNNWLNTKRATLLKAYKKPRNRDILKGFSEWRNITVEDQKRILQKSVRLHIKSYLEGLAPIMPFNHTFEERNNSGRNIVYGGFRGNLTPPKGTIVNYTNCGRLELHALNSFDTAHHETTHFIQHQLAVGVYNGSISSKHPFFNEGNYFLFLMQQNAYIPSIYGKAYKWQPNEVMADREGGRISSGIQALAL